MPTFDVGFAMSEAGYAGIAEALEEAVPVDGSMPSATMAIAVVSAAAESMVVGSTMPDP